MSNGAIKKSQLLPGISQDVTFLDPALERIPELHVLYGYQNDFCRIS